MRTQKKKLIAIAIVALAIGWLGGGVLEVAAGPGTPRPAGGGPGLTFTPQVDLPGTDLRAQEPRTITSAETFIGTVIVGVYRYGVWLTITAAIFATMLGGLLWLLAGGNASRVDTAKRLIGSSLFGLVLAFTSYLVLQGINPRLLELKLPVLPKVQSEVANQICCKDPVVAGSPPTYHPELDVSVEGSTETKCRDGSDAVVGIPGACTSTCCVCYIVRAYGDIGTLYVYTGPRTLCYAGIGLTEEWCKSSAGKPELSAAGVTETLCVSHKGNCEEAAKKVAFSCERTFNRTN